MLNWLLRNDSIGTESMVMNGPEADVAVPKYRLSVVSHIKPS